ncbi:MAG: TetR/AcrR family transcriptional regulator [Spirochaetaceae bacterium]
MEVDKRALLLSIGMQLFARDGYRDVSISQVTSRASVSVGTFYNHFSSKEDFYGHILDLVEREGIRKAERIISRLRSPMNKLKAVYRFVTLGVRQNRILRGVLLHDVKYAYPGLDAREGRSTSLRRRVEGMLRDIILEGSRKGVFRTGLYDDPTRLVISVFNTLIYHIEDDDIDVLLQDMLSFLQRGLRRTLRLRRRDERHDRRLDMPEETLSDRDVFDDVAGDWGGDPPTVP